MKEGVQATADPSKEQLEDLMGPILVGIEGEVDLDIDPTPKEDPMILGGFFLLAVHI